ncbi:MAG TPA: hypothetical protein VHJ17_17255 [Thermomonospora sp.]|nr:hypothetical protein [Thermomonospora sp.]
MTLRYIGSGPYCYANSLAMVMGAEAPEPGVIEVVTGSPFGLQLHEGRTPFFDPPRADHFMVVLGVEDDRVLFHDPHGFPFATLPVADFVAAWRTDSIGYPAESFTLWSGFRRVRNVAPLDAVRAALPAARDRLLASAERSSGAAAEGLAALVEMGLTAGQREHLVHFAVRVGTRRLADAATWLARAGQTSAADVAEHQARLVGSLQHPLVVGDDARVVHTLRLLAPTYERLGEALVL